MSRHKTYRQAIIMTALIILLCLASLTGATLALFTNDINDGTIGIVTTSGEVDIDIVDANNEQLSLVDRSLEFVTTAEQKRVLFEPGATFYTQGFKVKNKGDIPVNFSLSVSKDDKIDLNEFNQAFELWIVKQGDNFDTAEKLTNFKGRLEVGECSTTYYLFVKMKESVGNEFQGKSYTGIGVTVYAVQGNATIN